MGGATKKLGCVSRLFGPCFDPKRARARADADTAAGDRPRPPQSSHGSSLRSASAADVPQSKGGGGGKRSSGRRARKKVKIHAPQSVDDILSLASDLASSVCSRQSSKCSRAGSVYHDAHYDHNSPGAEISATIESNSSLEEFEDALELDGQYFFTAEDDPDIPSEVYEGIHRYPARPTDRVDPRPKSRISVSNMQTLLHDYQRPGDGGEGDDDQGSLEAADRAGAAMEHQAQRLMMSETEAAVDQMERSTEKLLKDLKMPDVRVRERGFPGELDESELESVKRFRSELSARDPIYGEIVRAFSDVEEEAYALCRWLRARKFDVDKVFELLDQARPKFEVARARNFYPDFEAALGFPRSVFLSQYPAIFAGNARNGCPVMYLRTGLICPDGIKSLVCFDVVDRFFWNDVYYGLRSHLARGRRYNPDFVRSENIGVYDLKGLSRSQVTGDTFEMIKVANGVMASFPETLHCLLIINAPSWFGFIWAAIRKFIDPRTASKIEVVSFRFYSTYFSLGYVLTVRKHNLCRLLIDLFSSPARRRRSPG